MDKEQYYRLLELNRIINSTYGVPPKHPDNLKELYTEYLKLRKMYCKCKKDRKLNIYYYNHISED